MYLLRKEEAVRRKKAKDLYKLGLGQFANHEYAKAAESFTLAISHQANIARYYFARGNCFRYLKEYQRHVMCSTIMLTSNRCIFDYSMAIRSDDHVAVYYGMCD